MRLPEVSAQHHDDGGVIAEPLRRWRQGYTVASGQTLRKRIRSPGVVRLLMRRQRYEFGLLAWVAAGIASVSSPRRRVGWAVLSAFAFLVVASRLGVAGAVTFVAAKATGIAGLGVGLFRPTPDPETFPTAAVEVVAPGRTFHGDD